MGSVIFSHPNTYVGQLTLRIAPVSVEWEYTLNVNRVSTHGGEVIQLLSMDLNKLQMDGQFGIEGPHGLNVRKNGGRVERTVNEFFDLDKGRGTTKGQPYQIGLTQMTEYFRRYFQVASQGGIETVNHNLIRANHDQRPMTIRYQTELESVMRRWTGYPTDFPSYARSNEDFAPLWHVEFEIEEPDKLIQKQGIPAELRRLRTAVGYEAYNPFSDPTGAGLENKEMTALDPKKSLAFAKSQAEQQAQQSYDELLTVVGATDPSDIIGLIRMGASAPSTTPSPFSDQKKKTRGISYAGDPGNFLK